MRPPIPFSASARPARVTGCALRESALTLDALLAEIGPHGGVALDVALDLRCALHARVDATLCVELALRLRRTLGEQHYLAFYRVRMWLVHVLALEVRGPAESQWTRYSLPLHTRGTRHTEHLEHELVQRWAHDRLGRCAAAARVRYVFAATDCAAGVCV